MHMTTSPISKLGETRGWSAKATHIDLPLWTALVALAWASAVGVYAFWSRVVIVVERRRSVLGVIPTLMDLTLSRPLAFMAFHWLLSVVSLAVASWVLVAWRQSPSGPGAWFVLWLAVLLLQSFVWHWRLRVCRLILARR